MENNYYEAYKEVLEVLKYMSEEDVNKLPKDMILTFETKQDKSHIFEIDVNKSIEEQNLLEETKDILANIFRDYWATEEKREKIIARENFEREKQEIEKREKYNPDKIFENKNCIKEETYKVIDNELTVVENKSFGEKIKDFFKKLFKIK